MANIQQPLQTNSPFSTWGRSVANSIRKNSPINSDTIQISNSPFGTTQRTIDEITYKPYPVTYCGEYSREIAYKINDVVRVIPGKKYSLPWDSTPTTVALDPITPVPYLPDYTPILTGTINGKFAVVPNWIPIPGVYICVQDVPDQTLAYQLYSFDSANMNAILVYPGQSFDSMPTCVKTNFTDVSLFNINYCPTWPELPNIAYFDVNDTGKYYGRYWELISLLPTKTTVCVDETDKDVYVDSQSTPEGAAVYA
jgi:hypothetical protein